METNCMGLDKFQLTIIKSNYTTIKPFITKMSKLNQQIQDFRDKMAAKIKEFEETKVEETKSYEEQIAAIDAITKAHTKRACGIELTTEQVINFLNNSQAFEDYKNSIGLGQSLFETKEETTKETINSESENSAA